MAQGVVVSQAPVIDAARTVVPRRRRRGLPGGWALLFYLAGSALLYHRSMLPNPLTMLPRGNASDPAQMAWFLTQTPTALLHGHNPFVTDLIDYPYGVNLTWNTLMPLAGMLAYPVTATLGPVAAWNLLALLGPATTAWTARLWIGRHTAHQAAAWVGGLLVGFGPFVGGHAIVHLNFVLLPLVPVMLMLVEDLLWRRPRPQWRTGLLLGAATAAQGMLSEETVVIVVTGVAVAAAATFALRRAQTWAALRRAAAGLAVAVASFLVLLGYQLAVQLFGPHRAAGLQYRNGVARPDEWVVPTARIALHAGPWGEIVPKGMGVQEVTAYIGVPMILVAVAAAVLARRRLATRIAIVTMLAGMVLTLGSPDGGYGRVTLLPRWLFDQPIVGNVLPLRFSLIADVALAFLTAVLVDTLLSRSVEGDRRVLRLGLLTAAAAAVATVLPAPVPPGSPAAVPAFFTSGAARRIPAGAAVLVLPYPGPGASAPMLWQAVSAMNFQIVGGYAIHPEGDRVGFGSYPDAITTVFRTPGHGARVSSPAQLAAARRLLFAHHVRFILLDRHAPQAVALRRTVRAMLGRGPTDAVGGMLVWNVEPPPGPAATY
jgi:hypothetical protein